MIFRHCYYFFDSFNGLRYAPSGHRWAGVDNAWEQKKTRSQPALAG
jgi:hypothetical protein